jgi:hypothetical protein
MYSENRLHEINATIRHYESDDRSNSLRKDYLSLEKSYQSLKKDADSLREELDIASLDPKEAHTRFVARVNEFKNGAKTMEEKAAQVFSTSFAVGAVSVTVCLFFFFVRIVVCFAL